MKDYWVAVSDLAPAGSSFVFEDMELWNALLKEFQLDCRLPAPLRAELFVQPLEKGLLVRGSLQGEFFVPCSRCTEETALLAAEKFEHFVPLLSAEDAAEGVNAFENDQFVRSLPGQAPELNIALLCAEEFMLALPVKALCRADCKGLCLVCGTNLNEQDCACDRQGSDPRLEALRKMKINR